MRTSENQIVVYQPSETIRLDVRLAEDTIWLALSRMTDFFQRKIVKAYSLNVDDKELYLIDAHLYAKYGITKPEQKFYEFIIKPME